MVGDAEVYVCGVIDVDKERARLTAQTAKLRQTLEGVGKKLDNEQFVARAKPAVVEKERARLADLEVRLETLGTHLKALD